MVYRLLPLLTAAVLGAALLLNDQQGRAVLRTVQVGIGPTAMAVDEATGRVFVIGGALNDGVDVLGADTGAPLRHVSLPPITSYAIGGSWAFGPVTAAEIVIYRPDNTIVSLDAHTGATLRPPAVQPGSVALMRGTAWTGTIAFHPAQNLLIASARAGGVAWRRQLPRGAYPLAASARLGRIYLGLAGGSVALVDARTGLLLGAAGVPSAAADQSRVTLHAVVSERTGHLFVLRGFEGGATLAMLDARSGRLLRSTRHTAAYIGTAAYFPPPQSLCYVDDRSGMLTITSFDDDVLRIYSARSGRLIRAVALAAHPMSWAIDPVRRLLLIASAGRTIGFNYPTGNGSLSAIDLRTGTLRRTISVGAEPIAVAVDPRTARAFVLNANVNPDFTPLLSRRRAAWWLGPLGWLSNRLPFLPHPSAVDAGSVTVVDTSRL